MSELEKLCQNTPIDDERIRDILIGKYKFNDERGQRYLKRSQPQKAEYLFLDGINDRLQGTYYFSMPHRFSPRFEEIVDNRITFEKAVIRFGGAVLGFLATPVVIATVISLLYRGSDSSEVGSFCRDFYNTPTSWWMAIPGAALGVYGAHKLANYLKKRYVNSLSKKDEVDVLHNESSYHYPILEKVLPITHSEK